MSLFKGKDREQAQIECQCDAAHRHTKLKKLIWGARLTTSTSVRNKGMTTRISIVAALIAITQMAWMIPIAQAKQSDDNPHGKSQQRVDEKKGIPQKRIVNEQFPKTQPSDSRVNGQGHEGPVPIGGYFKEAQREAARAYYERQENRGYCPPGLAKKGNDCQPPGQAKKWQRGYPLPTGLLYYEVPRSVVVSLGTPPAGYKYVRVASDILLIAVGTSMVVDAIEDLVR